MNTQEPIEETGQPEATAEAEVTGSEPEQAEVEETAKAGDGGSAEHGAPPATDLRDMRIQMLERALADREATLHSYIRAHKKAEADFEAFRQRLERDRDKELLIARAKLVERLLDVEDNLERTIDAARRSTPEALPALVQGVEMVHRQFVERLGELGLERIEPTGKPFDPNSMEALGVVPVTDPAQHDRVVLTMRTGYRVGDQEIRPALVQVGRMMS